MPRIVPAVLMVMNTNDKGAGSLRDVVANAPSGSTIQFDPNTIAAGSTITLTTGEIEIKNKDLTINGLKMNITISGNNNSRIFDITQSSEVEIDNLSLENGWASAVTGDAGSGGAIDDQGSSLKLVGDNFSFNTAAGSGGAIYTNRGGGLSVAPLTVTDCFFSGNAAASSGGAIFATSTSADAGVVFDDATFIGNSAVVNGGAVDAEGSADTTLQATLCTFTNNWVSGDGDGGAIFTTDTTAVNAKKQAIPTITLSSFSNNTAAHGHGGALAYEPLTNTASSLLVSYNTFTNNSALAGGGVFSNVNTNSGAVTEKIVGCLFNGNQATPGDQDAGGGLFAAQHTSGTGSNTLNVYNSTFYQNSAVGNGNDGSGNGGGIYLYIDASGTGTNTTKLTSLTAYKNTADFDGGGLYVDPTSDFGVANSVPQLLNSIIAGNLHGSSDFASGPDIFGSIVSRAHNLIGNNDGANVTNGWQRTDIVGTPLSPKDPGLDPNGLANNGGPTQTIALITAGPNQSLAYQKGDPNLAFNPDETRLDQRGYQRPAKASIGAYDPGAKQVQKGQSTTTVTSSNNPAQANQPVTFTAQVTTNAGTPTGSVTFQDGNTVLGTVSLDAYGFASLTTSTLASGNHNIMATYSGDDNSAGSSGTLTQVISQENSSFISLSSSASNATLNQPITFTATVNGSSGTPTGSVTFLDGDTVLSISNLDGTGKATFTTSTLPLGSNTITAVYSGDGTYGSNSASLNQTISQGGTFTSVNLSVNPAQPGQAVTFTATVLPEGSSGSPSGTVTFLDGTTVLATVPLSQVGSQMQAAYTTSTLSSGSHAITAVYGGDNTFMASSSTATETIGQPSGVGSSVSVSASTTPALLNQPVTLTATVTGMGGTPSGSVTFFDGTTVLGTASLSIVNGQAKATLTTSTLGLGSHTIVAVYSGDGTFNGSANSIMLPVNQGGTSTSLTSSANPSPAGQDVTFTATVQAMGMGVPAPTGTVSFFDGTTFLGVGELTLVNGQMQATFTTAALGLGSHRIIAVYTGDSTFADSGAALQQTIS